jgi:hypothetical protein
MPHRVPSGPRHLRTLTTLSLLLGLSAGLVLAACAGDERPGDDRFTVTVEDGVTVARTRGGPLFAGDLFTLEPLLTLQQDPEVPESLLFRATSFRLGPDGRYYVSDYGNSRIAVYDAEGRFETALGRRGDGPGEFYQPYLQSIHDGVVSVFDFNHQRESRFDLAGRLLETVRLPGGGLTIGLQRLPEGGLLCSGVNAREEDEIGWTGRTLTLLTPDGSDTLWTLATGQVPENRLSRIQVADGSWSTLSVDMPFPPTPTAQWVPGQGFLLAEGDHPELRWYDLEGRLTGRALFEPGSHDLTDAVKRQYEERLWQQRVESARRRGREPRPVRDMVYPDRPGIWSWSVTDTAGDVWLLDTWSEELGLEEDRGHRFHVVAADGRYLGTTLAPVSRITLSGDRLLAAVEDEESGEVDFTVFRLVPALPGLVYP